MIILITGASCTGKTKLANDLMTKYNIPYFSVDILMMGLYRSNNTCNFTPNDNSEKISLHVWPILKEMIFTNIENSTNYIYEGFQIKIKDIIEIKEKYKNQIFTYYLSFSREYIENNYSVIKSKRSIIENRTDIDDKNSMLANVQNVEPFRNSSNYRSFIYEKNFVNENEKIIESIGSDIIKFS